MLHKQIGLLRYAIINALSLNSALNIDGREYKCYTKRLDGERNPYAHLDVGTAYNVTLAPNTLNVAELSNVIKLQSKGIYPILTTLDNQPSPFCIGEYLRLADGCIAINGYCIKPNKPNLL